ncbi:MAG: VWA domain-containing protein, partial [Verrucomicrobiota bacterium]
MNFINHTLAFGRSSLLWMLVAIIPLAYLFWAGHRRRERLLAKVVALRLRAVLLSSITPWRRGARSILLLLAWAFLVLALAEPRWGYEEKKVVSRGRDVMIAIDTSRSMLATDVTPTRLARAELLGQDVLDLLPGDRVGLIAFAGSAFLQAPMTLDHNAVTASLAELDTALIPKGGTDISEAIRTAEVAFGKGEGTSRALIIITDGEDLEEDAIAAAKQAAAQGIKIFTIGIGSVVGSLIPIRNENGGTDFVRDERGKPVLSKLDEPRLKEIAQAAGGFYEPFSSQAARTIVEKGIAPLEAGLTGEMSARKPIERYEIPASVALLLLMFSILLKDGKSFSSLFRKKGSHIACWIGLFILGTRAVQATPGIQEYQQGNYEAALQSFEQRLEKIPSSPEVRFDAGTAAYKNGDYQKAADYFTSAMTASDQKLQEAATYNLANTLVRSGEQQQDRDIKLSDWKNALQHYDTVLKQDPNNKNAKENRDLVKKLMEDLQKKQDEKTPPQNKNQQQQDQKQQQGQGQQEPQNQNQNQQQNQPKENEQQPPQASGSPNPTPTPSPNNDQKNQQGSSAQGQQQGGVTPTPTPSSSSGKEGSSAAPSPSPTATPSSPQQQGGSERSSQQQQPGGGSQAAPRPTPGEKKSGALQAAGQGGEQ